MTPATSGLAAPIITNLAQRPPREYPPEEPLRTQHAGGNAFGLVAPFMVPRYGEREGQEPRIRSLQEPSPAVVPTGNGGSLVAAHIQRDFGQSVGQDAGNPLGTITPGGGGKAALVACLLTKHYGGVIGTPLDVPTGTITTQDHHALTAAFLQKYYGQGVGSDLKDPAATIPTKDRMGLVTVQVEGEPYYIADIYMRMLAPRELFRAQGFDDAYVINRGADGRRLTKTEQVRLVGNSVSPPQAAALVRANCQDLVARDEARKERVA